MPFHRVPNQHRFGIISHSQRIELQEKLLYQAYSKQEDNRLFKATENPFQLNEEFLEQLSILKTEHNKEKIDALIKIFMKKIEHKLSPKMINDHFYQAWNELSLLWQLYGKVQEECEVIFLISLEIVPLSFSLIPILTYMTEGVLFVALDVFDNVKLWDKAKLWRTLKTLETCIMQLLLLDMVYFIEPFKDQFMNLWEKWLELSSLLSEKNLPSPLENLLSRAYTCLQYIIDKLENQHDKNIPLENEDDDYTMKAPNENHLIAITWQLLLNSTDVKQNKDSFIALCQQFGNTLSSEGNGQSDAQLLLVIYFLGAIALAREDFLEPMMDFIFPLFLESPEFMRTPTTYKANGKITTATTAIVPMRSNALIESAIIEVITKVCIYSKTAKNKKIALLHDICGLCTLTRLSSESNISPLLGLETCYAMAIKVDEMKFLQAPLWNVINSVRKHKKPNDVNLISEISKLSSDLVNRLAPYLVQNKKQSTTRIENLWRRLLPKKNLDYSTTTADPLPTSTTTMNANQMKNNKPVRKHEKVTSQIKSSKITKELMMPNVYQPKIMCPYEDRIDRQLFRVVEDQWRTQVHLRKEEEVLQLQKTEDMK